MKKIAITGPESTGKSAITELLAKFFYCPMLPEYARAYLEKLDRAYNFDDITEIAKAQAQMEDKINNAAPFLFCDTDMLVCKIWQEYKYGTCDPWLENAFQTRHYDLFLLCNIDLAWEYDHLREHPDNRKELFDLYETALIKANKPYVIISGIGDIRLKLAVTEINRFCKI
jgi:NadR type nicotinamide-nucleotide adenylyltransferase